METERLSSIRNFAPMPEDYPRAYGRTQRLTSEEERTLHEHMHTGLIADDILELADELTAEESAQYNLTSKRGMKAKERMIESHLPLVVDIAKKIPINPNGTLGIMDYIQEGNIGLIKAVERFEPERGVAFSTYAYPYIKGEILDSLLNFSNTIRISRDKTDALKQLAEAEEHLAKPGHEPSSSELAAELNVSEKEIDKLLSLREQIRVTRGEKAQEAFEYAAESAELTPEEIAITSIELDRTLSLLTEVQRDAIVAIHLEGKTHPVYAEESEKPMGTNKGNVRLGLKKLRKAFEKGELR